MLLLCDILKALCKQKALLLGWGCFGSETTGSHGFTFGFGWLQLAQSDGTFYGFVKASKNSFNLSLF